MTEVQKPQDQGDKNGNVNCLEGVECPKCGEHGVVDIEATMWVRVLDNGTENVASDTEYNDNSPARCPTCGHEEPFGEWRMDTCDRCQKSGSIHVGHEQEYGYDGLCDSCLDLLAEAKQT